jgi:hypothetical protein
VAVTSLFKGKFILALACMVLWTSAYCAVTCAMSQYGDVATTKAPASEPPCHHHPHGDDQGKGTPAPCDHLKVQTGVLQSFERVAVAPGLLAIDFLSASQAHQSLAAMALVLSPYLPPLPHLSIQFSVILRI